MILRPVKRSDKIINIKFKEVTKNSRKMFRISDKCSAIHHVKISKDNQLAGISNETCIPPLLSGKNSSCPISQGYHILKIEHINSGVFLLNDFYGEINKETASGTFLIKFHNGTLNIKNKFYRYLEAPLLQVSPPVIQQTPVEDEFVSPLSLQMLNNWHINNTKIIHEL